MLSKIKKLKLSQLNLIFYVSLFIVFFQNWPFVSKTLQVFPFVDNAYFIISLVVVVVLLFNITINLLNLFIPLRPLLSLFLLIGAVTNYFASNFGTIFNDVMIINIMETSLDESLDIININFTLNLLFLGLLPSLLLYRIAIVNNTYLQNAGRILVATLLSTLIISGLITLSTKEYASFIRYHKELRTYITPLYPFYSSIRVIQNKFFSRNKQYKNLSAKFELPKNEAMAELIVVIVGETARADHFSLNAYSRLTNPMLSKESKLISFTQVSSCGTSTSISVPCMFSFRDKEHFKLKDAQYRENVLDTIAKTGTKILWRDNNSSSKHVADRLVYEDFKTKDRNPICDPECRDIGMLKDLDLFINKAPGNKLIVMHQMGSHGPAYHKRYPKAFEKFTPACKKGLEDCTQNEIINAYDNTILYTDYFIATTINFLKQFDNNYEITLIYVSDHGESLGEKGLYLHGLPSSIAPKEQTHIPLIIWAGKNSDIDYPKTRLLKDQPHSHDIIADTLLKLFEVNTDMYANYEKPLIVRSDKH